MLLGVTQLPGGHFAIAMERLGAPWAAWRREVEEERRAVAAA
jgi:hypothetical protein